MNFPYIDGRATQPPAEPLELPAPDWKKQTEPAGYLADPDLIDAVNVALLLGQPLLLTGEPGTGKTQLAFRLAWELGYSEPLVFNTKTTSTARDLFYVFDAMSRFHVAQTGSGSQDNLDYLTYNPLGRAVLFSLDEDQVKQWLPKGFQHPGRRRSVVLIDEIDKAPRDFPNDLLHEVDTMSFRIPELQNIEVRADQSMRPILVLTSNSEKNLPDAFLRRCVFYNIPFPSHKRLVEIVQSRLDALKDGAHPLLESALALFLSLRKESLRKPPSTAELINWLQALVACGARPDQPIEMSVRALKASVSTLAKTREDADDLVRLVEARFPP